MIKVILSICVPTYNRPERIAEIINQFIQCKINEIELVISYDNPENEETHNIVKKYKDSRIKYYRNKKNIGYDANLLITLKRAKGEFVFILMDDDDLNIESLPWIIETIKKNENVSQLCGIINDNRPDHKKVYFSYPFKSGIIEKGLKSLKKLLFFYPHGSGIILRRNLLDFITATSYIGCLYMQQVFIAQALVTGDTLISPKVVAYIGKIEYKSNQPRFKGKFYWEPLARILQIKFKIQIIYDITKKINHKKVIRRYLFNKQKQKIVRLLPKLLESFKEFIFSLDIIIKMKISRSFKFWIFFLVNLFLSFFPNLKFSQIKGIFNRYYLSV